ncbi:hypothetical protein INR49_026877 [Caranx melampygus]|nr:hypothetical protein INR49_026877 [Caranx melampygus]
MAIISGMNMSPVSRLKKTWSKVKTAKFDILEHQMDPSSNFYNYRTALRGATQRSITANSSREKLCKDLMAIALRSSSPCFRSSKTQRKCLMLLSRCLAPFGFIWTPRSRRVYTLDEGQTLRNEGPSSGRALSGSRRGEGLAFLLLCEEEKRKHGCCQIT